MTPVLQTAVGLAIPFVGTALGAAAVFLFKSNIPPRVQKILLGFASGVMLAASVWSLLLPALELSGSWLPVVVGFLVGIGFLLGLDQLTARLHLEPKPGTAGANSFLLVLAVTLHNVPEGMAVGAVNGSGTPIVFPPSVDTNSSTPATEEEQTTSLGYTPVTSDLYYSGGYLGTLRIPAIGLSVRAYEGTDSSTLMKGAGHFKGTSIWDGNCAIAGHNRGVRDDFGDLHTLERGDTITWTTKLGVRTYEVTSVQKVKETDTSGTAPSTENMLTLYTCVCNQRAYRWQVQAVEVV